MPSVLVHGVPDTASMGCLVVQRVASTNPDLIRTLACGSGPIDRAYEWHAMAQLWQTPRVGEQMVEGMLALSLDDRIAGLNGAGSPAGLATEQAEHLDELMGRCILSLYRSAITVGAEWEDAVAAMPSRPVLVLWGNDDPFVGPEFGQRLAARVGGELVAFDGCGHWWPWERAQESAEALERLWASVP
ncbi:MAG: alpha/beta fold hydrolase [Acidimicrobiia bacterium]